MRYLRKYENHEDIHAICQKWGIKNINADGSIDVNDYVNLQSKGLTKLPLKFRNVVGNFTCHNNHLTSLEGCPKCAWKSSFYCNHNELTSLIGCPKSIDGDFNCEDNEIESFDGLDFIHICRFYCGMNPIYYIWILFFDHTKFEFFNDCDIIRENRVIILERLNFFLDYIGKDTVTEVEGYKCI